MAYSNLQGQRSMALDATRNAFYDRALARCITPESVVLDLGAGIGIFGLLALKHGARRVYCVEPHDVGALAVELAAANGWCDRLAFLQGRIEEVELPEKVDVIVSAMTGNLLLNEDLLPTVFHARDRYLRDGGTLLPSVGCIDVAPVAAPEVAERHLRRWSDDHLGLDVRAGRRYSANALVLRQQRLRDAIPLGPTQELFALDLAADRYGKLDAQVTLPIHRSGACDGIAAWLRMRLGDDWLSTGPFHPRVHWSPGLIPFDPPLAVSEGDALAVRVVRPPHGDWAWRVHLGGETREGSTLFARPRPASGTGRDLPVATRRGRAVAATIAAMDGRHDSAALVRMLRAEFEDVFPTEARARQFVRQLSRVHGRQAPGAQPDRSDRDS